MLNSRTQSADEAAGDTLTVRSGKKKKKNARTAGSVRTSHKGEARSWALGSHRTMWAILSCMALNTSLNFSVSVSSSVK